MTTKTTKRPNTKSRSPKARRQRAAVRDYLAACFDFAQLAKSASELDHLVCQMRVATASSALAKIEGYAEHDAPMDTFSFDTPCTPGHEVHCLLGEDDACDCNCRGGNHGKFVKGLKPHRAAARG